MNQLGLITFVLEDIGEIRLYEKKKDINRKDGYTCDSKKIINII